jgi:hypothetical protein
LFAEAVQSGALAVLKTLGAVEDFHAQGFYLAGGTGLALQFGHRVSEDLDFFTEKSFEPETVIRLLAGRFAVPLRGLHHKTSIVSGSSSCLAGRFAVPLRGLHRARCTRFATKTSRQVSFLILTGFFTPWFLFRAVPLLISGILPQ